jgi:NAD(P)-dependent dehydrogenase (short-subunit alcohol dehydrogenase family)
VLPLDVASEESQAGFSEALKARNIDTIDILIANAGISSRHHPVDPAVTCSVDDMTNVYATNCVGSLLSLQHHTPRLLASRTKLAVLISSVMGSTTKVQEAAQRGSLSYRVSKAALNMMAVTYANEPEISK